MKHLISSDVNIKSIMRSLDVDKIFSINSVFNIIKEQFLKVFGYNNKNIKLDEIRDFLLNVAYQKPGFLSGIVSKAPPLMLAPPVPGMVAPVVPNVNIGDITIANDNNSCVFITC